MSNNKRTKKQKIIAVDFDGVIVEYQPIIGFPYRPPKLRKNCKKYMDKIVELGYVFVLWSGRDEKDYQEMIDCCKKWDLPIEYTTNNLLFGASGKLVAYWYIDDRSLFYKYSWKKIYRYIFKHDLTSKLELKEKKKNENS